MIAISRFMSSMGRTINAKSVQATPASCAVCQLSAKSKSPLSCANCWNSVCQKTSPPPILSGVPPMAAWDPPMREKNAKNAKPLTMMSTTIRKEMTFLNISMMMITKRSSWTLMMLSSFRKHSATYSATNIMRTRASWSANDTSAASLTYAVGSRSLSNMRSRQGMVCVNHTPQTWTPTIHTYKTWMRMTSRKLKCAFQYSPSAEAKFRRHSRSALISDWAASPERALSVICWTSSRISKYHT